MATPVIDPDLLDQLSRRCKSVATQMDQLGADVYALSLAVSAEPSPLPVASAASRMPSAPAAAPGTPAFATVPAAAVPAVPVPSAPGPAVPAPSAPVPEVPAPSAPVPAAPVPATPVPAAPPPLAGGIRKPVPTSPRTVPSTAAAPEWTSGLAGVVPGPPQPPSAPVAPREPWWERDGVVSRVLALGGVAITLIGVVMLLVLAARAGLLRPEVRVGLGVVLAGVLLTAGLRIQSRPGGRVGGIALAATGVVAGYLDLLAATSLYDWVPAPLGLALAALVAAGGVLIARRWESPQLLIVTTVAAVVTAPVITSGVTRTLVVFYLLLQVSGAVLEVIDGWTWLAPVRTVPVVLAALLVQMLGVGGSAEDQGWISTAHWNLVAGLIILAVGVAAASIRPQRQMLPPLAAVVVAVAALPALVALALSSRPITIAVGLALTAALLGARAITPRTAELVRTVDATLAGVVLAIACLAGRPDDAGLRALPFLIVAIVSLALTVRTEATFVRVTAGVYAALAALGVLVTVSPGMLARGDRALVTLSLGSALSGLLLVVVTALAVVVLWRAGVAQRQRWVLVPPVFFGLYGVTAVCVSVPVAVTGSIDGFHLGHLLATFSWALAGAAILAFGLARPSWARLCLAIGLTVIAAAVAKLLTYDLASLTGLTRAVAFLGIGLLLLLAGTRYARVFADRQPSPEPEHGAGGIGPDTAQGAAPSAPPHAPAAPAAGAAHPRSVG